MPLSAWSACWPCFDSTYSQNVHSRNFYQAADLRWTSRFVDVVGRLPDGRMMVDYRKFHDTEPDPDATPLAG